jgi:hypothetical protein
MHYLWSKCQNEQCENFPKKLKGRVDSCPKCGGYMHQEPAPPAKSKLSTKRVGEKYRRR